MSDKKSARLRRARRGRAKMRELRGRQFYHIGSSAKVGAKILAEVAARMKNQA